MHLRQDTGQRISSKRNHVPAELASVERMILHYDENSRYFSLRSSVGKADRRAKKQPGTSAQWRLA